MEFQNSEVLSPFELSPMSPELSPELFHQIREYKKSKAESTGAVLKMRENQKLRANNMGAFLYNVVGDAVLVCPVTGCKAKFIEKEEEAMTHFANNHAKQWHAIVDVIYRLRYDAIYVPELHKIRAENDENVKFFFSKLLRRMKRCGIFDCDVVLETEQKAYEHTRLEHARLDEQELFIHNLYQACTWNRPEDEEQKEVQAEKEKAEEVQAEKEKEEKEVQAEEKEKEQKEVQAEEKEKEQKEVQAEEENEAIPAEEKTVSEVLCLLASMVKKRKRRLDEDHDDLKQLLRKLLK